MRATITSVHMLNIQEDGAPPEAAVHRFQRIAEADGEGGYKRPRMRLTEEWCNLDTGWVADPEVVVVSCPAPEFELVPDRAQRDEAYGKEVELGVEFMGAVVPFGRLKPGTCVPLQPVGRWKLRAVDGTAVASVYAC